MKGGGKGGVENYGGDHMVFRGNREGSVVANGIERESYRKFATNTLPMR